MLISEDGLEPFLGLVEFQGVRKYSCAVIINTYHYIDDTGLVKTLSTEFGNHKIPILYITTLNNNFILFDFQHQKESIDLLQKMSKLVVFSDQLV